MYEILSEQFRLKKETVRQQSFQMQLDSQFSPLKDEYLYENQQQTQDDCEVESDEYDSMQQVYKNIQQTQSNLRAQQQQQNNSSKRSQFDNYYNYYQNQYGHQVQHQYSVQPPIDQQQTISSNLSTTPNNRNNPSSKQKNNFNSNPKSSNHHKPTKQHRSRTPLQSDSGYNPGIRLYLKGIKKQEEMQRQAQEAQIMKDVKEQEGLTFKPQLVTRKSKQHQRDCKPEEYLLNYGKIIQEKHAKLKQEYERQEILNYDFKPKINKKSALIDFEKSMLGEENVETSSIGDDYENQQQNYNNISMISNKNRFLDLYEQGMQKKLRQQKLASISIEQDCTFKPKLIARRTSSIGDQNERHSFGRIENSNSKSSVFDRMYDQAQHQKEKIQQINQMQQQQIDHVTGHPLFRPQTGRSPITRSIDNQAKNKGNSIGEYLYQQHYKQLEKKQKLVQFQEKQLKDQHKNYTSNKVSQQIIQQKQRNKLSEIFQVLDSDNDGQISSKGIDIKSIPADILEILSPLLCEMEQIGETLDRDEFIDSALALYQVRLIFNQIIHQTLNVHQKNQILKFNDNSR
eukprot:403342715